MLGDCIKSQILNSQLSILNSQFFEQREILVLLLVHLLLGARGFVLLAAEVQYAVNNHSQHLLACSCAIQAGIIAHRLDVDEDVACNKALFQVAIIEGYDIGEVVVAEELDVHRTMTLGRAEDVVYLPNFVVALLLCHFAQPAAHKSLLRQAVGATVGIKHNIHSAKIEKIVLIR